MCNEIHIEEKKGLSLEYSEVTSELFFKGNKIIALFFLCNVKGFKIIHRIAADFILMGYSSKVYEDLMRGFYNWNPNVMCNDNSNACVLENWLET